MDGYGGVGLEDDPRVAGTGSYGTDDSDLPESEKRLVERIGARIKADKAAHAAAFKQMRKDMRIARLGYDPGSWNESRYSANVIGHNIDQKVAVLYAKNPKATAKRRETLDFQTWDETPESLMLAMQTVQQGMAMQAQSPSVDPMTGQAGLPQPIAGMDEASSLVQDFQQGMMRRHALTRMAKTLEILYGYQLKEQQPVDFKTQMRKLVRRALTCGVSYIHLQFERAYGTDPVVTAQLADAQARMQRMQSLMAGLERDDFEQDDAEMAELEGMMADLQARPDVVTREGLLYDFPASPLVIPDRLTKDLIGFIGGRWLTIEMMYTKQQVNDVFGVDLGTSYTSYKPTGVADEDGAYDNEQQGSLFDGATKSELCCVYKHYDRETGRVYFLCDGHKKFLRPPAPPDVKVEGFFPVFALVFNEIEDDKLFPPSDVWQLRHIQAEYNRSRDGKREHRRAARPRWAARKGMIDEDSMGRLAGAAPFTVTEIALAEGKLDDAFMVVPVPGVDPNLYDVGETFQDMQLIAGTQRAQLGGLAKASATETAVAADSSDVAARSDIDSLDMLLTRVARVSGQVLCAEMSPETVLRIVGPGAFWPDQSQQDIADELYLEVEAGSSGKPNQAMEIANWERLLPSLLQMPSISPEWLARETLRRLDDRMDLTDAIVSRLPAIVAQNRMAQPMTQPGSDPTMQGAEGGDKNATPQGAAGSPAPMGAAM